jgi:ferredoxin
MLIYSEWCCSESTDKEAALVPIYVITEGCIDVKDKSCVEVCPVDCIHSDEEDRMSYIDPETCTGCHACLPACPVGAIVTDDNLPTGSARYAGINAGWFRDRGATRRLVNELAGSGPPEGS